MVAAAIPEVRPDIHGNNKSSSRTDLELDCQIICRNALANPA